MPTKAFLSLSLSMYINEISLLSSDVTERDGKAEKPSAAENPHPALASVKYAYIPLYIQVASTPSHRRLKRKTHVLVLICIQRYLVYIYTHMNLTNSSKKKKASPLRANPARALRTSHRGPAEKTLPAKERENIKQKTKNK